MNAPAPSLSPEAIDWEPRRGVQPTPVRLRVRFPEGAAGAACRIARESGDFWTATAGPEPTPAARARGEVGSYTVRASDAVAELAPGRYDDAVEIRVGRQSVALRIGLTVAPEPPAPVALGLLVARLVVGVILVAVFALLGPAAFAALAALLGIIGMLFVRRRRRRAR